MCGHNISTLSDETEALAIVVRLVKESSQNTANKAVLSL